MDSPAERGLHVELEEQHVAVFHDVFLAFHTDTNLFRARRRRSRSLHQRVVGHGLGLDEAALKIGVDDARRLRRGVAVVDRPRADFFFARRKIRPQA